MDRRFAFVLTTTRSFGVCLIASHPSAKNAERMGHPSLGLIYISLMNGWATGHPPRNGPSLCMRSEQGGHLVFALSIATLPQSERLRHPPTRR